MPRFSFSPELLSRYGLSMVEVMVAVIIVGLALGPLIVTLSSSNRASTASIYEIMAVHYAGEISEQLRRLSSRLQAIENATGKTLDDVFQDAGFISTLSLNNQPPQGVYIPGTNITLFLSPLDPNFTERLIQVTKITQPPGTTILTTGTYWDVKITLSWKLSPNESPLQQHTANFSLILWQP